MNAYKLVALVFVSILVAILLAAALNDFTRLSDSALAESARPVERKGGSQARPDTAPRNLLPIIFLNSANAGGFWSLTGNAGTDANNNFLGTMDNVSLTIRVSNTVAYRIVPASDPSHAFTPNLIGGAPANTVTPGLYGATIGGGGVITYPNVISGTGNYAFIGGGELNTASGSNAFIGGGYNNIASGYIATIGGGAYNNASGASEPTIGGGAYNTASGSVYATVGGGYFNTASDQYATVGGGANNTVSNTYATVGGGGFNTSAGSGATVAGGGSNTAASDYATIAGGGNNNAKGAYSTVAGGWSNSVSNTFAFIGGGFDNTANGIGAFVGGGGYDGINPYGNHALGNSSAIGGGVSNTVTFSSSQGFIGGGYSNSMSGYNAVIGGGYGNTASGYIATIAGGAYNNANGASEPTIGGGAYNTASGSAYSTIGGGYSNTAGGPGAVIGGGGTDGTNYFGNHALGNASTIGGGISNTIPLTGSYAVIGGGEFNTASDFGATVSGGESNTASNQYATIPGGYLNVASGNYSFAAGYRAKANGVGTFVWSDSQIADFFSTGNNQFLIRANGGVGINTNNPAGAALRVISGTSWFQGDSTPLSSAAGKGVGIGYNSTGDFGEVFAFDYNGVAAHNLILNGPGGKVGIGTTTPTRTLEVNGNIRVTDLSSGGPGAFTLCYNASGDILGCSSSLRYKNNINPLTLGLDAIARLRPVTFNWKDTGQADLGFVAEEVNQVTPLLTTLNAQGQIEGVKYDRITALLVKGMQEQQTQIDDLKIQNTNLQSQVSSLQAENVQQQSDLNDLKARVSALEQGNGTNPLSATNVLLGGITGLLALMLVKRRKQ